jgi:hypothetical protein
VSDKFAWGPGDVVLSQCAVCKHLGDGPVAYCAAFPGAIPVEILHNEVDHRKPWTAPETGQPGDMGIPLERSITFEPREGIHPAALAALYRDLDQIGPDTMNGERDDRSDMRWARD